MNEIDRNAKLIWDYTHMNHQISPSDAILALGSMDTRVASRAAELWHQGVAEVVVVSGGFGRLSGATQSESEAEIFRDVLLAAGVPEKAIIVEDKSTNTGENLTLSIQKLENLGQHITQAVVVTKPYAEKRTFATAQRLFPAINWLHTSPQLDYHNYPAGEITRDLAINIMVGEVQRIKLYPELGYTISMHIPDGVEDAMKYLIEAGFDKQLIK